MRNLRLERQVERELRIIAHIEESKRRDPDRDRRLLDNGSVFAHPDRCSIYDTPIPYLQAVAGDPGKFNPKRGWEYFLAGTAHPSQAIAGAVTGWKTIAVPKNASIATIIAGGAGSGGGAGLTAATGNAKGGGGGGASGSVAKLIIPTRFLPSILWYFCALGGIGGTTSGAAGGIGTVTFVCDSGGPQLGNVTSVFGDIILRSGAASATGGVGGTASGASAGGASETIATSGDVFLAMGIWQTVASACPGAAGGNAVGPTAGGNLTWGGSNGTAPFGGGAGGGAADAGTNTPTAGGAINTNGLMQSVLGGATGTNAPGGAGGDGQSIKIGKLQGFGSNGGGGGGAAVGSSGGPVGGRGGNAGDYCSGGGGGGAGITFGPGGNSGRGFVHIIFT